MDEKRRVIDPSKAHIDLDALSLVSFSIRSSTPADLGGLPISGNSVTVSATMSGGLGRITGPTGLPMPIDQLESFRFTSVYQSLDDEHLELLNQLFYRWGELGILLRFVDFGDHALLLEDGDHVVVLPPGQRDVHSVQALDG